MTMAKAATIDVAKIEQKFEETAFRISQERNDFLLPQVIDLVRERKWVNLAPAYQRRLVWDDAKRSLFIESLLLNVPIPPVFLYEQALSRYEVMDGQQRLNSIVDFYENEFALKGLERWTDLNGLYYRELPETLKRGLARRRISATVLLVDRDESNQSTNNDVRKLVFERLNTGGAHLTQQELRNCLNPGPLNNLIIELSADRLFTDIWRIPAHTNRVYVHGKTAMALRKNKLYSRMQDCELVLRFFALRERGNIKGSVKSMLDRCIEKGQNASPAEISELRDAFRSRLQLAWEVFGTNVFRYRDEHDAWKPSQPLYDGLMVALDRLWDKHSRILKKRIQVMRAVDALLAKKSAFEVIIGRPNTAKAVKRRIDLLEKAIASAFGN